MNPPLEVNHHWRQITGLMVARNFVEQGPDVFHPRVDEIGIGGRLSTGIIGMEFPFLNYLIYLVSLVFGYDHWYGRLINLLVSSVGVYFFYRLIEVFWNRRVALAAAVVLTCSVWFAFSRKTMPDTFSISWAFMALWCAFLYLKNGRAIHLFLYLLLASIAILTKLPAGIYLAVIPLFLLEKKWENSRRISVFIFSIIPLLIGIWWYFIWNPALSAESGMWYNIGEPLSKSLKLFAEESGLVFSYFYFSCLMSYVALILVSLGLYAMFKMRDKRMVLVVLMCFSFFVAYALISGRHFVFQHYYMIYFAPVMALLCGYAWQLEKARKWLIAVLVISALEAILNQAHDFRIHDYNWAKMELEEQFEKLSNKNDLIIVNGEGNPQELYLSHRKGWTSRNDEIADPEYLNSVVRAGAKYLLINKRRGEVAVAYPQLYEDETFIIYGLIEEK